jgi:hypothetical protein
MNLSFSLAMLTGFINSEAPLTLAPLHCRPCQRQRLRTAIKVTPTHIVAMRIIRPPPPPHLPQFSTQSAPIAFRASLDWSGWLQLALAARRTLDLVLLSPRPTLPVILITIPISKREVRSEAPARPAVWVDGRPGRAAAMRSIQTR